MAEKEKIATAAKSSHAGGLEETGSMDGARAAADKAAAAVAKVSCNACLTRAPAGRLVRDLSHKSRENSPCSLGANGGVNRQSVATWAASQDTSHWPQHIIGR